MKVLKNYLNRLFIDGLSGMALGLFATLIIGTIVAQVGNLIGGVAGDYLVGVSQIAKTVTGAGIGVGVASKLKASPLVTVSAAVAGMVGAFPDVINFSKFTLGAAGEPLGAFVAAYVAIEIGSLITGKTKLDIILTPLLAIGSGAAIGIFIGPYISKFMTWLGNIINVNVDKHPVLGGMIIAVLMGMVLTLPISSAAIGIAMSISGLAAGAATVGCCCQMVGFAIASYRENQFGGLIAQGVGTSMLQVPNILKNPLIWLPPILSSAVLGPISAAVLKMTSSPVGSGMGSSGFVGQFAAYETMTAAGTQPAIVLLEILLMHFVLPGVLTLAISEGMRKAGWIHNNDMLLKVN